ncbi:MAG: hypothetical protein HY299_07335 [Verrucomicrobia bacterium]|nr:hypothetical protein [Verrucomicrobiota bacterium]
MSCRAFGARGGWALVSLVLGLALLSPGASQGAAAKGGVGATAISVPSGPGSVEGLGESFEPQLNTGTATFGQMIVVPPGRAGLQPVVRLTYDAGGGNGLAGVGWTIGFGGLARQTDKGFPRYDSRDTFLLGGAELVPLSNPERDWRCENEHAFNRIRQLPGQNAWEVTDKSGVRSLYGQYRGEGGRWSAITHPTRTEGTLFDRTYFWGLDTTIDLHGNHVDYEYLPGDGVLYPSRITYAHLNGNYHEVTFQYENRLDTFDDYRPTFSVRTDLRLKRVEVASYYDGARHLVRAYDLEYSFHPQDFMPPSPGLDLGFSLLKRIVQRGADGNPDNYLPPVLFSYSSFDTEGSRLSTLDPAPALNLGDTDGRVQIVDIDGDGLPDLFQTTEFDQRFMLNRGETDGPGSPLRFSDPVVQPRATAMQLSNPESTLTDQDGDGLADYVQYTDSILGGREMQVFRNAAQLGRVGVTPPGMSDQVEVVFNFPPGVSLANPAVRQMDVNFDKIADFIVATPGLIGMFTMYYRDADGVWQTLTTPYPNDMPGALSFEWNGTNDHNVFLADMNGDRLQDIVLVERIGVDLRVTWWPYCALGQFGNARSISVLSPETFHAETPDLRDVFVQDFTGDGLADLLQVDGSGAQSRIVLRANVGGWRWSQPIVREGLPLYQPRDPFAPTTFRFADLNGNNSVDLIWVNPGQNPGWQWLELMPHLRPNLIVRTDNNLGKVIDVTWANSTEDMVRAREKGFPWQTLSPFPTQVIRRLRVTCGFDLDDVPDTGRPLTSDQYISEFQYRDAYYDAFERQFRGFAFAQKVEYGDDFLLDTNFVTMIRSPGWDPGKTPTGQVSGPSLVTRLRYHTGAPDGLDNDEYAPGSDAPRYVDEFTPRGGREEEPLKGLLLWQETSDPWVLHDPSGASDFDKGCFLAATSSDPSERKRMTPDANVYTRLRSSYTVRRLYRSAFPEEFSAELPGGRQNLLATLSPPGRFAAGPIPITSLPESGRGVSFAFNSTNETEIFEANGLLRGALGYPARDPATTRQEFDVDDYGSKISARDYGIVSNGSFDDERFVTTSYAREGEALKRWILDRPSEEATTDEHGLFVSTKRHYYDGAPFVGLPLGRVGPRGLNHRTTALVNGAAPVPALTQVSDTLGDPRLPSGKEVDMERVEFDAFGNVLTTADPLATPPAFPSGHGHRHVFDSKFQLYCVEDRVLLGAGQQDLVFRGDYDYGFGVVVAATDFSGFTSRYLYDTFSRVVKAVLPGDSEAFPTLEYEYLPADTHRGRVYRYDPAGNLTLDIETTPASRVISRQRETAGQPGQYVSLKFFDGAHRCIGALGEGDAPGHWIVLHAGSFNRRMESSREWLPYDIRYGAGDTDYPGFAHMWTSAGRPPPTDTLGESVVSHDSFYDPMGRLLKKALASTDYTKLNDPATRHFSMTRFLPFEGQSFDENDNDPASPHANTPIIRKTDGLGRLIESIETSHLADDGTPIKALSQWSTRFAYNLQDLPVRITDSQGNVKAFRFDGLGRKVFVNDPDRGSLTLVYDDGSNQIESVDAKGQRCVATFDGGNRLSTCDYLDDASPEFSYHRSPDIRYHYDAPAGPVPVGDGTFMTGQNLRGRVAWIEDEAGEEHYSYDGRGRATQIIRRLTDLNMALAAGESAPLVSYSSVQEFDSFDRLVRFIYPDNDEIRQEFGSRNLVSRVIGGPSGYIISNIAYFAHGRAKELHYGDGVVTTFRHDPRQRLTRITTQTSSGGVAGTLIDFSYNYDAACNLTAIQDMRPATAHPEGSPLRNTQVFNYDALYRLTEARYSFGLVGSTNRDDGRMSYRHDRIGNLLAQESAIEQSEGNLSVTDLGLMTYGGATGRFNRAGRVPGDEPGPHALTGVGRHPGGLKYDANGNVTEENGQRYTWDFKDRLVAVESEASRAEYRYDYGERRLLRRVTAKKAGAESFTTSYPFQDFEVRPNDEPVKYVWMGGTRIARVTGSLSNRPRLQRVRLTPGWNLVGLAVTATNAAQQLAPGLSAPDLLFRYVPSTGGYSKVGASETLPAGTVLWLHSSQHQVMPVLGAYSPMTHYALANGGQLIANADAKAWNPLADGPTNSVIWIFDGTMGTWRGPSGPGQGDALFASPSILLPGEAALLVSSSTQAVVRPSDPRALLYYHQDHLGSSAILTDAQGNVIEENTYYPYGTPRSRDSVDGGKEAYGFSQKERDMESGLHYFTSRYQSPVYARFISVDNLLALEPKAHLGNPQALNFYGYCLNNPIAFKDPNGCNPLAFAAAAAGAYLYHKAATKLFPSLGHKEDAAKKAVVEFADDIKKLKVDVDDGGTTTKAKVEVMAGVWFGDKDIASLYAEFPTTISSGGKMQSCAQAGLIALDGRVTIPFMKECHVWSEGQKPPSMSSPAKRDVSFDTKSRYSQARYDDRTYSNEINPGIGKVHGMKVTAGADITASGGPPTMDSKGRLQWDMGVGIIAGGEFAASAGSFEAGGKFNGTARLTTWKEGDRVHFAIQGYGYGELTIVAKIPATANMLQFPVRISGEGTIQRSWSFSVDQIRAMKGL